MEHPIRQRLAEVVDSELAEVILGLLHPDLTQRMSASAALCCPVFKEHVAAPLVYNLTAVSSDRDATAANLSCRQLCITEAGTANAGQHCQADAAVNDSSVSDSAGPVKASANGMGRAGCQPCNAAPQSDCDEKGASVDNQKESSSQQVGDTFGSFTVLTA